MRSRRGLTVGALAALIVVCGVGLLSVAFRSLNMVFDLPLTEDGYYVMTVARNVARGVGFSVDGTTLTNGFHPLWAILSSLGFLVGTGSDELAMRVVLFASAGLAILSAALWARVFSGLFGADDRLYRVCFVLVYLTAFPLLAQHFNGLETGLLLALLAATGLYWTGTEPSVGRSVVLGLLLGLLVLVRIDAGIFAVLVALEALWRGRRHPPRTIVQVAVMTAAAVAVAGPWFAYNFWLTGWLTPVSGLALGIEMVPVEPLPRAVSILSAVVRNAVPSILGELSRIADAVILLVAGGVAFVLLRRQHLFPWRADAAEPVRRRFVYLALIMAYLAFSAVYYAIGSQATFFYQRYLILAALPAVGVFSFLLYRLATSAMAWVAAPVAVVMTGLCLVTVLGWHGVGFGQKLNRLQFARGGPCLEQVDLARSVRLPGEVVGGVQSGTLAFFVEGAINLDGRVNVAAYKARRAGKLMEYVLAQRIGLLVDYEAYLEAGPQNYFNAANDPLRYFRRAAPTGPVAPYDWVALRRISEQAR